MYDKSRLIAYINSMLHSCLLGKKLTHPIAICPNRKKVVAILLDKYEKGEWMPFDEMVHTQDPAVEKHARGQLGDYAKEDTGD